MASLIVIALVLTVAGVLAGGFIAISFAISRGHHVRSVIWKRAGPYRPGHSPADRLRPPGLARRPRALASAGAASALRWRWPSPDEREAA